MSRSCEICGKNDIQTAVMNSAAGPMSRNLCSLCAAMGADEQVIVKELELDLCLWYDHKNDCYKDIHNKIVPIKHKNGKEFETRDSFIRYTKRKKQ